MTITFWRVGRAFLVAGVVAAALTLLAAAVLSGTTRLVVSLVLGIIAANGIVQGGLWTALQYRTFGGPHALARTARSGTPTVAKVVTVASTSGRVGADPIVRVGLEIGGDVVDRRVRVPFGRAAALRPGARLPVLVDPRSSRAILVEWQRLP